MSVPNQAGQKVRITTSGTGDDSFEGAVTAIDPKVDLKSRNVLVRATLTNTKHRLLPGSSAEISIDAGKGERQPDNHEHPEQLGQARPILRQGALDILGHTELEEDAEQPSEGKDRRVLAEDMLAEHAHIKDRIGKAQQADEPAP